MRFWALILLGITFLAQAEMVDTFQFKNTEERIRAVELAKSLRCPQCQNQNLVESNSPIAYDLRIEVYKMIDEGKTNQQIIEVMTSRFGNFVLYKPPFQWTTALLWGLPIILLFSAVSLMLIYLRQRAKTSLKSTALSAEQQQALANLLEKKQ
ncbi:cytochrome c biogenesis protein CcmH [Pasteurellaceae bacterium Pebbles2]|nr:cytochrome c biogenesis protein CcmH [Pasteurellaceae bacterium Pebbles2]